jgi:hypothetical protein
MNTGTVSLKKMSSMGCLPHFCRVAPSALLLTELGLQRNYTSP